MHITIPQPKTTLPTTKKQKQKRKQPSIEEIERAISAGRYRDIDAKELDELDKSKFDWASMSFSGKFESPVEKKLRETGESLETWTQTRFRETGKKVLVFVFQWIKSRLQFTCSLWSNGTQFIKTIQLTAWYQFEILGSKIIDPKQYF
nr:putative nad(p)h dehydrogenase subunit crr3, chloroplastic [Quercus suber]